jgi:protein arginine kinase
VTERSTNAPSVPWFAESGPENDCVISTRVRFSRNLAGFLFNERLQEADSRTIQEEIAEAFHKGDDPESYTQVQVGDITQLDRRILMERNIIPQEYTLEKQRRLFLHREKNIFGVVHHVDHLRLISFKGGLNLHRAFEDLRFQDQVLEENLDYAVSLDLGYLSTEVQNLGTGMKVSTMLHLPALAEAGLAEKACKAIVQIGLGVKGFWGDENHSLGNMYQIANTISFGLSERDLLEKLENVTYQIVNYERRVREELVEKRRVELEDKVFRSYGLLTNCRTLTAKEGIEHLLNLRLGVVLGWISLPLSLVTELLFECQTAHMQKYMEREKMEMSSKMIDIFRAERIRDTLAK